MSKDRIKEIAIQHFNRFGYEGVRMAQIAEDAGIRKQSLSYHFPTKKDLLVELYGEVVEEEISFVRRYFRYSGKKRCLRILTAARALIHANRTPIPSYTGK